jgi:hypothetical protein
MAARACALAGSLLSLLRWWLDRGEKETADYMDKLFHQIVWNGLQAIVPPADSRRPPLR